MNRKSLILFSVLAAVTLTACAQKAKSSQPSTASTSSSSSLPKKPSSSSTASSSSNSISQQALINLLAVWIQNFEGMYEVQSFSDADGNLTFLFINGGRNGTGVDYYGNSSAGTDLKAEQNSVQFVIKGSDIAFQIPTFPNGITGDFAKDIVWQTHETLSTDQLQQRFGNQASAAAQQIVSVKGTDPYAASTSSSTSASSRVSAAMNLQQVQQGDYSSIQGTWENASGKVKYVITASSITIVYTGGSSTYTYGQTAGSGAWQIPNWGKNGKIDANGVLIIPIPDAYLAFAAKGTASGKDISPAMTLQKDAIWSGQNTPSPDDIAYRIN